MDAKTIRMLGALGGLIFFISAMFGNYIAVIGILIGIFLLTKAKEFPQAKTHGIIVIVLNVIALLGPFILDNLMNSVARVL